MDIIILGPTATGKTALASYLSYNYGFPIFNCDSVQIYEGLDCLTNKPRFDETSVVEGTGIRVCKYKSQFSKLNQSDYDNLEFFVIGNFENLFFKRTDFLGMEQFLVKLLQEYSSSLTNKDIQSFLFNIRLPGESYSSFEFYRDVNYISRELNITNKIIVGGTIYYAYNYIFKIHESERPLDINGNMLIDTSGLELQLKDNANECIEFLKTNDPKALDFIDPNNHKRLYSAVKYILRNKKRYSDNYFKKHVLRENVLILIIKPKDRKRYYQSLDVLVEERFNKESFIEINRLVSSYGDSILSWLSQISYEYRFFIKILSLISPEDMLSSKDISIWRKDQTIDDLVQKLKYKEHQYSKRQITFLRKIERSVLNYCQR